MTWLGAALGMLTMAQADADPQLLKIGPPGQVTVAVGKIVATKSGKPATVRDIARAADGQRFVYLGESHTNPDHHKLQAQIIEALVRRGRNVIVGFEMFTRPKQDDLNPWTLGWWSEAEFIQRSEWKTQWGFDFALYRPIFEAVRTNRLPMIALNVPRDWVRAVGRGGLGALTPEQKAQLPAEIDLGWKLHKQMFTAMIGGHPMTGPMGDNMYAAQVLWDVGMADSVLKYWDRTPRSTRTVVVVIAGSGHVMYNQAINGRIAQRTGEKGLTVVMVDAEREATVSRGIGDFVYAALPPPPAAK